MHERLRWEAQNAVRQTFGATGSSDKPDPLEVLMGWGRAQREGGSQSASKLSAEKGPEREPK